MSKTCSPRTEPDENKIIGMSKPGYLIEYHGQSFVGKALRTTTAIYFFLALVTICGYRLQSAEPVAGAIPTPTVFDSARRTNAVASTAAANKLRLLVGDKECFVEVASTVAQQNQGLMYRTQMGENDGMLFVFPAPRRPSVWMKNTILPLSCAFLDVQGRVLEIIDLVSLDETPVRPQAANVKFMLEMNRGWFEQNEIKAGTVVQTDRGVLGQTYRSR